MQLTTEEIIEYKQQLATYKPALIALEAIEDCEGDLEGAATSLAIEVGQRVDRVDWLDGMAKRCRVAICQDNFQQDLQENQIATLVGYLLERKLCPPLLVVPIVIYVLKKGLDDFCQPLNYKLK